MKVKIEISLKEGVLDPQAKTISHGLESLGFSCVKNVTICKTMFIDIDTFSEEYAMQKATEMSEMLLANPVIETYNIEILH